MTKCTTRDRSDFLKGQNGGLYLVGKNKQIGLKQKMLFKCKDQDCKC